MTIFDIIKAALIGKTIRIAVINEVSIIPINCSYEMGSVRREEEVVVTDIIHRNEYNDFDDDWEDYLEILFTNSRGMQDKLIITSYRDMLDWPVPQPDSTGFVPGTPNWDAAMIAAHG